MTTFLIAAGNMKYIVYYRDIKKTIAKEKFGSIPFLLFLISSMIPLTCHSHVLTNNIFKLNKLCRYITTYLLLILQLTELKDPIQYTVWRDDLIDRKIGWSFNY